METSQEIKIIPLTVEYYERLASYLSKNYIGNETPEYWLKRFNNWWEKNPYQKEDDFKGWIITSGSEVLGFIGCFNSLLSQEGQDLIVRNISTWTVSEKAKSYSLKLLNQVILNTKNTLIFCTTGTKDVTKVLHAYKFFSYEENEILQTNLIPICLSRTLLFKLNLKNLKIPLINPLERLVCSKMYSTLFLSSKKDIYFKPLESSDNLYIDKFWNKIKSYYSLTTKRDAIFYNWYCFQDQIFVKHLIGIYKNESLVAISTFVQVEREIKVLECRDFIFDKTEDLQSLKPILVKALIDTCRKISFDLVSIPEDSGIKTIRNSISQERAPNNRLVKIQSNFLNKEIVENAYFTNQGDIYI